MMKVANVHREQSPAHKHCLHQEIQAYEEKGTT